MLTGVETILVTKPVSLFFLKQELEEHTTVLGLERIIREVNKALSGHRDVSPVFTFQKVGHVYQLHIWANTYGRGQNAFISTVEMTVLKNATLGNEWLALREPDQERKEVPRIFSEQLALC